MRLLYVASGHPLQEADDCLMWDYLGIDWYSTGYYSYSDSPGDLPPLKCGGNSVVHRTFKDQSPETHPNDGGGSPNDKKNHEWTGYGARNIFQFTPGFLSQFDCVLFNHFVHNLVQNWPALKKAGVQIMLKTYNMHEDSDETMIKALRNKGVISIRNSPVEWKRCPNTYGGHDAIIRGSVVRDEDEMCGWAGKDRKVVTFTSNMQCKDTPGKKRYLRYCNTIAESENKEAFHLCGHNNNGVRGSEGFVSHEKKVELLRNARVNFVVGTPQATNTYSFVEALVMGQPIVVFNKKMWNSDCYEIDSLIEHGKEGFIGNCEQECAKYIDMLLDDESMAAEISKNARLRGVATFGRRALAEHWRQLFISRRMM